MIEVLDIPAALEITGHSLTADDNAGQEVLPHSGTVQRLAPTFERFRGTWTFKPPKRSQSLEVEAFFLKINRGRALFRTTAFQPSRSLPTLGGTVNGAHSARAGSIAVTGFLPNRTLPAGEWVQIGWQAFRLTDATSTDASGAATLSVFPFLHHDLSGGEEVRLGRWVKILWRMVGEPAAWTYAASRHNSLQVTLEAIQEIVTTRHELSGEEVPE